MLIAISVFILACLNLLMVSSLSPHLLGKQILLWILGAFCFWLGKHFNPQLNQKNYKTIFFLSCLFLIIPLVSGQITRGSKRWLDLGITKIQPSEIVKPFLMLVLANTQLPLLHLIPVFLVILQPDLGSATTLLSLLFPCIITNHRLTRLTLICLLLTIVVSPIIWQFGLRDYQKNRIITFINPTLDPLGKGYHTIQSKIAIGSAGFWGKGYKKGTQGQLLFLPEKHTDFVLAATIEELGLLGGMIILTAYFLLIKSLVDKSKTFTNSSQTIFTIGICSLIWTQVFINIGMNLGILPITGIPLPFLSVGGSSLISLLFSLGIIYSS